jgi:hypothetical protein
MERAALRLSPFLIIEKMSGAKRRSFLFINPWEGRLGL